MDRFKTYLDTSKRNLIVTDVETGNSLTIQQECTSDYLNRISDNDTDGLVEFANDLAGDMESGVLALELFGNSTITFTNNNWPQLSGGVYLRQCSLGNPNLTNVRLWDVQAPCAEELNLSYSTIEHLTWDHGSKLSISHCFINEKYNKVLERMSMQCCEWFMNERVDGELW